MIHELNFVYFYSQFASHERFDMMSFMPRPRTPAKPAQKPANAKPSGWTFLTNHAHVLICLSQDGDQRMRDLAVRIGITERAVQKIIAELIDAGYLTATRDGRRNTYQVVDHHPLRHPVESHRTIRDLLALVR
jgi:hypothetical protein